MGVQVTYITGAGLHSPGQLGVDKRSKPDGYPGSEGGQSFGSAGVSMQKSNSLQETVLSGVRDRNDQGVKDATKSSDEVDNKQGQEGRSDAEGQEVQAKGVQSSTDAGQLSEQDLELIRQLSQRDREVRAHEEAHVAAGGPYVRGGPHFNYQVGPDGKQYAIGGEVSIDTSAVPGDPEATMRKAMAVRRAALAPAHPSAQDRNVAAMATSLYLKASQELVAKRSQEVADQRDNPGVKVRGRRGKGTTASGLVSVAWQQGMAAYQGNAGSGLAKEEIGSGARNPDVDFFV